MTWSLTWAVAAVLVVATQCQQDPQDGQECFPQGDDRDYRVKDGDCTFFWKCQLREGLERYMWTASKCVNGTVFNRKINRCEPPQSGNKCEGYSVYTPPLNVKIAPRTIRPGCERVFQCPPDLQFFIYPDWNNCSNYNTCVQGTISPESCLTLGYPWYNPSTFACEQQIASNNVCFFRTP